MRRARRSGALALLAATAVSLPAFGLAVWSGTKVGRTGQSTDLRTVPPEVSIPGLTAASVAPTPGLVGSEACAECHAEAYEQWRASSHNHTIAGAAPEIVHGQFGEWDDPAAPAVTGPTWPQPSTGGGTPSVTVSLRRAEGSYWAVFDQADAFIARNFNPTPSGRYAFKLDYTLGKLFYQTYLTRMPNGEIYVTPLMWDLGEKQWRLAGWRPWGTDCAHCHVTGLGLQENPAGSAGLSPGTLPRGYLKRPIEWLEMAVGCEICHGPGADHLASPTADNVINPARLSRRAQVDLCGTCHGMAVANAQTYRPGTRVAPPMTNAEVAPGSRVNAFWPTNQHKTYFTMYQGHLMSAHWQGVRLTCSPCHTAHGSGTRYPVDDNSQCTLCHTGYKQRLGEHTFHPPDSPGSRCVECHMPRNNQFTLVPGVVLMTHVHSHNITLPDPRVNLEHGVLDACSQCHSTEGPQWALEQIERLWGPVEGRANNAVDSAETSRR